MTLSAKQSRRSSGPVAAALGAWLIVQVAALGVCALRVMFWARSPRAGEQLGLFVMLAVQVAAASLLFPVLLQNWRSMAIAVVTAWPFAELAGFLADARRNQWVAGEVYVSVWLVTLYLWAGILRNSWVRLFGVALAAILSLGGPVLLYLRSEFSEGGEMATGRFAYFGPIAGAISLTFPDWPFRAWLIPMILFLSGVIAFAMQCGRCRDKLST